MRAVRRGRTMKILVRFWRTAQIIIACEFIHRRFGVGCLKLLPRNKFKGNRRSRPATAGPTWHKRMLAENRLAQADACARLFVTVFATPPVWQKPKISVIRTIRRQKQALGQIVELFLQKIFSVQRRERQRPVAEADV